MSASRAIQRSALWLGLFGLGASLMFLFDPEQGAQRRKSLRADLLASAANVCRAMRHIRPVDSLETKTAGDTTLLERVLRELERTIAHAGLLTVTATSGRVFVSGPVLNGESQRLEQQLRQVPGVVSTHLRLSEYRRPQDLPGVEGQRIWRERYSW